MKNIKSVLIIISITTTIIPKPLYAIDCYDPSTKQYRSLPPGESCPTGTTTIAAIQDIERIFVNIIQIAGVLFGFAFFIMMIIGGIRFLLSGGDPKAVQAAKGTITWAIIGLALFTLSYTILLIIQAFTGVQVIQFNIKLPT